VTNGSEGVKGGGAYIHTYEYIDAGIMLISYTPRLLLLQTGKRTIIFQLRLLLGTASEDSLLSYVVSPVGGAINWRYSLLPMSCD
jgi:hypothetical protein